MSSKNNLPEDDRNLGDFLESQSHDVSENDIQSIGETGEPAEGVSAETMRARMRLGGLALMALGAVIGLLTIGWPMLQAIRGAEEIWLTEKGMIAAIMFFFVGVACVFGLEVFADENNVTFRDMLMLAVLCAVGSAAVWAIESFFTARGYAWS